jgi:hypothetical protein
MQIPEIVRWLRRGDRSHEEGHRDRHGLPAGAGRIPIAKRVPRGNARPGTRVASVGDDVVDVDRFALGEGRSVGQAGLHHTRSGAARLSGSDRDNKNRQSDCAFHRLLLRGRKGRVRDMYDT